MPRAEPAYIEVGKSKVFAVAWRWPGWCRSAKTEHDALEALSDYAARYAPVAARAGLTLPPRIGTWDVRERVKGSASTDFGVPGSVTDRDREPITAAGARRLVDLVRAAWDELDAVVAVSPAALRKGPRGGGRDRDKMVDHVYGGEDAYARKMGAGITAALVRQGGPAFVRDRIVAVLESSRRPPEEPKFWPAPYAARRVAWHALDHAWEMQDRSV